MPLNKVNYVDGQTLITAQNMNDIQDEVIRLGEKQVVQSDWLEKDENSLAYVKNKPFGVAGQYTVIDVKEAAQSDNLIEVSMHDPSNNNNNAIYYLYKIDYNGWDFTGLGHDQKIAFEMNNGYYCTLYDMRCAFGAKYSLESYGFNNPNVSGVVQFWSDAGGSPNLGIVVIEDSTDSTITTGVYLCFNSNKQTFVSKVLMNSSCTWLGPGALSTIDMPLGVNYALAALEDIRTPLKPMIDSVTESLNNLSDALDNKVDKVGNKVLSDINFTKDYETQVKSISNLANRVSNLEYYHDSNQMEEEAMKQSAIMIANEIAANPRGVYLNTQELLIEYAKLMSGQTSDKVFIAPFDSDVFFTKISDKTPAKEDFKKGFSTVMAYPDVISGFMALRPQIGLMIPDIAFDPELWENIGVDSIFTDIDEAGSFIFSDTFLVAQEGNSMGFPKGLYVPTAFDMLILGLQINGFDLSSSTAPVSRAQIEDILLFIEESMITFTINGVSHRAIRGMTWGEWVNSRYNDTELTIVTHWQAGQIIGVSPSYVLRPYGYIRPTDLIQAEGYTLGQETAEPV